MFFGTAIEVWNSVMITSEQKPNRNRNKIRTWVLILGILIAILVSLRSQLFPNLLTQSVSKTMISKNQLGFNTSSEQEPEIQLPLSTSFLTVLVKVRPYLNEH